MTRLTKQELAAVQRVEALDKAIVKALKRFGTKLKMGDYMANLGEPGACVCAIGASLLARVPEHYGLGAAKDLATKVYAFFGLEPENSRWGDMRRPERRRMAAWAAGVVNDGITQADLLQLEEGFESQKYFNRSESLVSPDKNSPFYKLGVKLGKKANRGG